MNAPAIGAGSNEDMVITPTLGPMDPTAAAERARVSRRVAKQKEHRGLFERLARARIARKLARLSTMRGVGRFAQARAVAGAGRIAGMAGIGTQMGGMRAVASNPITLGIALAAVAAIVATRLATDTPFEGMGSELNEVLLGDMDDDARAAMNVREHLSSDPSLMSMLAQQAGVKAQLFQIANDLKEIEKHRQHGKSIMETKFPINGAFDVLILRVAEIFGRSVEKHHLRETMAEIKSEANLFMTRTMASPNTLSNDRASRVRQR